MEARPQTYPELIAGIRNEFGVTLEIVNTGGGNEAMHGRLETGDWLVVTDAEDFLSGINERLEADESGQPLGWFAGIYRNSTSNGSDWPESAECIESEQSYEARFDELNLVIREVLGRAALNASQVTGK